MSKKTQQVQAVLEAADVQRFHTKRALTPRTVGHHTYNALALLLLLYPGEPSLALVRALMWHDAGERRTGDVPGQLDGDLREALEDEETSFREKYGLLSPGLTEKEERWLRGVDRLEFFLWAHQEVAIGNQRYAPDLERCYESFHRNTNDRWPKEVCSFALAYRWESLDE